MNIILVGESPDISKVCVIIYSNCVKFSFLSLLYSVRENRYKIEFYHNFFSFGSRE